MEGICINHGNESKNTKLIKGLLEAIAVAVPALLSTNASAKPVKSIPDIITTQEQPASAIARLAEAYAQAPIWSLDRKAKIKRAPASPNAKLTKEELQCITNSLYHEARGLNEEAWMKIMFVIMERMLSKRYPDYACGVIYQPWQFSYTREVRLLAAPRNEKVFGKIDELVKGLLLNNTIGDSERLLSYLTKLPNGSGVFFYKRAGYEPEAATTKRLYSSACTIEVARDAQPNGHAFYALKPGSGC